MEHAEDSLLICAAVDSVEMNCVCMELLCDIRLIVQT